MVGGPYLVVHDAVRLLAVLLQHRDRLELAVVVVAGVAAARPRHERAVEVGSVVEPGAVVVVGWTHAAAARQLHTRHATGSLGHRVNGSFGSSSRSDKTGSLYTSILAMEMANPGNRHCTNCIGTLSCRSPVL